MQLNWNYIFLFSYLRLLLVAKKALNFVDILHLIIKYLYNILKRFSVVCIEIILFMIVLMRFAHSASCSSFVPVAFYMPIEEWVYVLRDVWWFQCMRLCFLILFSLQQRKLISIFAYHVLQVTELYSDNWFIVLMRWKWKGCTDF